MALGLELARGRKRRYRNYEYEGDEWDSLAQDEQRMHLHQYRKRTIKQYKWPAIILTTGYFLSMSFYGNLNNALWDVVWYSSGGWAAVISWELVSIQTDIGFVSVEINVGNDSAFQKECQPIVCMKSMF